MKRSFQVLILLCVAAIFMSPLACKKKSSPIAPTTTVQTDPAPCASPSVLGSVATNAVLGHNTGNLVANRVQMFESGRIIKLGVYLTQAGELRLGLYADDPVGQLPTTLIRGTASLACTLGWNEIDVLDFQATSGFYWVAIQLDPNHPPAFPITGWTARNAAVTGFGYGDFPYTFNPNTNSTTGAEIPLVAYYCAPSATPTPTPTFTPTLTPTGSATPTLTTTWSHTPTWTFTETVTASPTLSATPTSTGTTTATPTWTHTPTITHTRTMTDTWTETGTPTGTGTTLPTETITNTPVFTATPFISIQNVSFNRVIDNTGSTPTTLTRTNAQVSLWGMPYAAVVTLIGPSQGWLLTHNVALTSATHSFFNSFSAVYTPGDTYALVVYTSYGTASVTFIAPGDITTETDGTNVSWVYPGVSNTVDLRDTSLATLKTINPASSPYTGARAEIGANGNYVVVTQIDGSAISTTNAFLEGGFYVFDLLKQPVTLTGF